MASEGTGTESISSSIAIPADFAPPVHSTPTVPKASGDASAEPSLNESSCFELQEVGGSGAAPLKRKRGRPPKIASQLVGDITADTVLLDHHLQGSKSSAIDGEMDETSRSCELFLEVDTKAGEAEMTSMIRKESLVFGQSGSGPGVVKKRPGRPKKLHRESMEDCVAADVKGKSLEVDKDAAEEDVGFVLAGRQSATTPLRRADFSTEDGGQDVAMTSLNELEGTTPKRHPDQTSGQEAHQEDAIALEKSFEPGCVSGDPQAKRKRGRPRKVVSDIQRETEKKNNGEEWPPAKPASFSPATGNTSKRGREIRPPKRFEDDQDSSTSEDEIVEKNVCPILTGNKVKSISKRGRPRKNPKDFLDGNFEHSEDSKESILTVEGIKNESDSKKGEPRLMPDYLEDTDDEQCEDKAEYFPTGKDSTNKSPRKRGRPRKRDKGESVLSDGEVKNESVSKRKRGRPRKNPHDLDDKRDKCYGEEYDSNFSDEDVNHESVSKRKRGRPRKNPHDLDDKVDTFYTREENDSHFRNEDANNESVSKRKRGRPRKKPHDLDDKRDTFYREENDGHLRNEDANNESVSKKKRGRPRKNPHDLDDKRDKVYGEENDSHFSDEDANNESVSKRKRGRPRKNPHDLDDKRGKCYGEEYDSHFSDEDVNNESVSKRKRGRPRKNPHDLDDKRDKFYGEENDSNFSDEEANKESVTRRGRPKKTAEIPEVQGDCDLSDRDTLKESVSRRGRPKKKPKYLEDTYWGEEEEGLCIEEDTTKESVSKRGRPRKWTEHQKVQEESVLSDRDAQNETQSVSKRGRPKKKTEHFYVYIEDENGEEIRKISTSDKEFKNTNASHRKRGRPSKKLLSLEGANSVHGEGEGKSLSSGKKVNLTSVSERAQPRKKLAYVDSETEDQLESEGEFQSTEEKRGAYYIKTSQTFKHPDDNDDDSNIDENNDAAIRKHREIRELGTSAPSLSESDKETDPYNVNTKTKKAEAAKKRRRKSLKATGDKTTAHPGTLHPVIEKCLRCEEPMQNLSEYKAHLRHKHAALYTSECPEGEQTSRAYTELLRIHKKLDCPKCAKSCRFVQQFQHHLEWCGRENEMVKCEECKHEVKAMWYYHHCILHRRNERKAADDKAKELDEGRNTEGGDRKPKRKAAAMAIESFREVIGNGEEDGDIKVKEKKRKKKVHDGDWSGSGSNVDDHDDEEYDGSMSDGGEGYRRARIGLRKTTAEGGELSSGKKIWFRSLGLAHRGGFEYDATCDMFADREREALQEEQKPLFTGLLPLHSSWSALDGSTAEKYLPTVLTSAQFSVQKGIKGQRSEAQTLQWGHAFVTSYQATAYAGGPVRRMEWCPFDRDTTTRGQLLVVSAAQEPWKGYSLFKRQGGPGLLQFWTTGALDCTKGDCEASLKLAFCLAHDSGHILNMSWCPRGGVLPADTGYNQDEAAMERIGLLAVACSNTDVLVYSIPSPESLEGGKRETNVSLPSIYKAVPSLILVSVDPDRCGPCHSVSWQRANDCRWVAAGYARGVVHTWHLSEAAIERASRAGDQLVPLRSFFAHNSPVLCLDWSKNVAENFATAAMDGVIKFWDCRDTRAPLFINPEYKSDMRGPIRCLAFGSSTLDAVMFGDDQRDRNSGMVSGFHLHEGNVTGNAVRGYYMVVNRHYASVWDLGYSDWFNVVASCDDLGQLMISSCFPLLNRRCKTLTKQQKGMAVFTTLCTSVREDKDGEDKTALITESYPVSDLLVKFTDFNVKAEDLLKTQKQKETHTCKTLVGIQGFAADVTAARMNPNQGSSMWVAAGSKTGFVRLLHVSGLAPMFQRSRKLFSRCQTWCGAPK